MDFRGCTGGRDIDDRVLVCYLRVAAALRARNHVMILSGLY